MPWTIHGTEFSQVFLASVPEYAELLQGSQSFLRLQGVVFHVVHKSKYFLECLRLTYELHPFVLRLDPPGIRYFHPFKRFSLCLDLVFNQSQLVTVKFSPHFVQFDQSCGLILKSLLVLDLICIFDLKVVLVLESAIVLQDLKFLGFFVIQVHFHFLYACLVRLNDGQVSPLPLLKRPLQRLHSLLNCVHLRMHLLFLFAVLIFQSI